jgi:hypothetical protein
MARETSGRLRNGLSAAPCEAAAREGVGPLEERPRGNAEKTVCNPWVFLHTEPTRLKASIFADIRTRGRTVAIRGKGKTMETRDSEEWRAM